MKSLLLSAAAVTAVALFASPAPQARTVGASGIAYDEVTKIIAGGEAPEPGSFSADFSAAVDAQRSTTAPGTHHGLFGGIMNAMDTAKSAVAMMRTGTASSKYFLRSWERTDDAAAQTATILKPEQHQTIYLNMVKKTYRIAGTDTQAMTSAPSPMENPSRVSSEPPQPGTAKLDITVSTVSLGPKTIENVPTTGYKTTFSMSETQSTGSCRDGSFSTSVVEYVSNFAEPGVPGRGYA